MKGQWVHDPQWGHTSDGHRVWVEWWLKGDWLKSVYTSDLDPKDDDNPEIARPGKWSS